LRLTARRESGTPARARGDLWTDHEGTCRRGPLTLLPQLLPTLFGSWRAQSRSSRRTCELDCEEHEGAAGVPPGPETGSAFVASSGSGRCADPALARSNNPPTHRPLASWHARPRRVCTVPCMGHVASHAHVMHRAGTALLMLCDYGAAAGAAAASAASAAAVDGAVSAGDPRCWSIG
jgi:hypothetical protein